MASISAFALWVTAALPHSTPEVVAMSRADNVVYLDERPGLPSAARTLPSRFYTDPEIFRREMEAIFFRRWIYAGRVEGLEQPGQYRLVELAGESVIVLRDDRGELAAFYNVCRHRGTRLCTEENGKLHGALQCPYHAWTYDYRGRLKNAPFMEKTDGFDKEAHPLHPVAVDTWDGHIFLHLSPPASQSLAEQLDDLPRKFAAWNMAELEMARQVTYPIRTNWKLVIQNYSECLHCPLLHPQLNRISHFMSGENDPPHPGYLGGRMDLRDGVATLTEDGTSPWGPLPGLDDEQRRGVYYWAVLPGLMLNLHPDYVLTFQLLPQAVDRTDIVCTWLFHPEAIAKPDFDPAPAVDFWDLTNRQDWDVSEKAQQGIASRSYVPGPYSNREELLFALDRWVLDQLGEDDPQGV